MKSSKNSSRNGDRTIVRLRESRMKKGGINPLPSDIVPPPPPPRPQTPAEQLLKQAVAAPAQASDEQPQKEPGNSDQR